MTILYVWGGGEVLYSRKQFYVEFKGVKGLVKVVLRKFSKL